MKKYVILLLALTSTLAACRKEIALNQTPAPTGTTRQSISLKEVTDWYNSQADSHTVTTNSSGEKPSSLKKLDPDLRNLQSIPVKEGNYWLVNLQGQPTFNGIKLGYRKLAFLKDSTGRVQACILEIIPDLQYLLKNGHAATQDFTGRIFVYDQHYQLTGGLIYSQGKAVGRIKPKTAGNGTGNAAQLQTNMTYVESDCAWDDGSYVDADGVFTVYAEQICTYNVYDDGFYPADDSGGGGAAADPYGNGGSAAGTAQDPVPEPSNLPDELNPAVNTKDYTRCFDNVSYTGATMQVTVYVQEPFPGTTFNYGPNSVGHTAIGLTKTNGSTTVNQVFGFYPDATGKDKEHAPSKVVINGPELGYNVSITYTVSAAQFSQIEGYINNPPGTYDLWDFNCTSFAYYACQAGGITLPNPYNTVGLSGPGGAAYAMTPAGLGNSIANQGGSNVNKNGGNVPASHGACQ